MKKDPRDICGYLSGSFIKFYNDLISVSENSGGGGFSRSARARLGRLGGCRFRADLFTG